MIYPHVFDIKNLVAYQDESTGEFVKEWNTLDTFEGEIVSPSGSEIIEAQKLVNPIDHNVYMYYDDRIKPDMRVKFNDVVLDIHSVLPTMPSFNGEYENLVLMCSSHLRKG